MASERERPYRNFNFLVDITDINDAQQDSGGFQEVSGLGVEIAAAEYRNGNYAFNNPIKIMGLYQGPRRDAEARRHRQPASSSGSRRCRRARPTSSRPSPSPCWARTGPPRRRCGSCPTRGRLKYTGPTLSGVGGDVAVEELVLSCERIEQA